MTRSSQSSSEPMFNIPGAVLGLVLVLALVHGLRDYVLGEEALLWDFAFIPARFASLFGIDAVQALTDSLAAMPGSDELLERLDLAREIAQDGETKPWTLLTYALLHGSWMHLVLNSIWLIAFGSAVARRFGTARFLGFLALTAVAGALGHLATNVADVVPMVGASAAVSGCMAAAIRFAFQPGAPLGGFTFAGRTAYTLPAMPLMDVLRDRRPLTFLIVWLAMNVATGLAAPEFGMTDAAVAWQAHIGGFVGGLIAFPLFDPPRRDDLI